MQLMKHLSLTILILVFAFSVSAQTKQTTKSTPQNAVEKDCCATEIESFLNRSQTVLFIKQDVFKEIIEITANATVTQTLRFYTVDAIDSSTKQNKKGLLVLISFTSRDFQAQQAYLDSNEIPKIIAGLKLFLTEAKEGFNAKYQTKDSVVFTFGDKLLVISIKGLNIGLPIEKLNSVIQTLETYIKP